MYFQLGDDATFDERKGLLFKAKVRLKDHGITVNMRRLRVTSGMSVMVGLPIEISSVLVNSIKNDFLLFSQK